METESQDIVQMVIVDKREVANKSPNMEVFAFKKGLDLLQKHVNVKAVVTNGHIQIAALMSK